MTISLLTHGWICYADRTIINRYVVPYNLQIENKNCLELDVKEKEHIYLTLSDILDKQLNLKIQESQINIKQGCSSINIRE
jgi:hypothetical protein